MNYKVKSFYANFDGRSNDFLFKFVKDKKLQQQISKCNKHKATTPYMANQMKCVAQIRTRQTIFPNKKGK